MAKRFPRTESDVTTLAARVIDGLTNAAEDFPAPPVSSEELRGKLDAFQAADMAYRRLLLPTDTYVSSGAHRRVL